MGQGHYTVIIYGCVFGEAGEDMYDLVHDAAKPHGVIGRSFYEAKEPWAGFCVAADGSGVADRGDRCEEFSYGVMDVRTLDSEVRRRWPEQLKKCQAAYLDFVKSARAKGYSLPTGRLLLVADYD